MMRFDFHQRRRMPKLVDRFSSVLAEIEASFHRFAYLNKPTLLTDLTKRNFVRIS